MSHYLERTKINTQQQELDYIFVTGNLQDAQTFEHAQAEPTNADALSALQALIQFDGSLANAVRDAANVEEQNQLFATLLATVLAILGIAVVGWLISETLVRRLRQLHRMTKTVEEGQLSNRISVVGRDEVADGFKKLDMTLDQLTSAVTHMSATESLAHNSVPGLSDVQAQETARFALAYAQEINILLQRLQRIIQEMRSIVTPFRLEGVTDMSTAYQEAAGGMM